MEHFSAQRLLRRLWLAAFFFCLSGLAVLIFGLERHRLAVIDAPVSHMLRAERPQAFTAFMESVTFFGSDLAVLGVTLATALCLSAFKRRHADALAFLLCTPGSIFIYRLLKDVFRRARPAAEHLVAAGGYSFPSGHATMAMACYGMFAYLVCKHFCRNVKGVILTVLLAGMWIVLIAASRVYLGVHYPTDVLAGFFVGSAWLLVCIWINRRIEAP